MAGKTPVNYQNIKRTGPNEFHEDEMTWPLPLKQVGGGNNYFQIYIPDDCRAPGYLHTWMGKTTDERLATAIAMRWAQDNTRWRIENACHAFPANFIQIKDWDNTIPNRLDHSGGWVQHLGQEYTVNLLAAVVIAIHNNPPELLGEHRLMIGLPLVVLPKLPQTTFNALVLAAAAARGRNNPALPQAQAALPPAPQAPPGGNPPPAQHGYHLPPPVAAGPAGNAPQAGHGAYYPPGPVNQLGQQAGYQGQQVGYQGPQGYYQVQQGGNPGQQGYHQAQQGGNSGQQGVAPINPQAAQAAQQADNPGLGRGGNPVRGGVRGGYRGRGGNP